LPWDVNGKADKVFGIHFEPLKRYCLIPHKVPSGIRFSLASLGLNFYPTHGGGAIMGEPHNPFSPVQPGSDLVSLHILGNFYIKNHHYFVICLGNHFASLTEDDLSGSLTSFADLVVGQLQVDQQPCTIVEVEYCPSKDRKSDVTTLLTAREFQIVRLVAQGHANKQIAHQLHISEWTVSTHLRRIFAKLGVDSRAAMVYQCHALLNTLN
jgi:DNA-binding CsgD family transcriptional regulator